MPSSEAMKDLEYSDNRGLCNMADTLFELRQKVAMKSSLEAKLRELQSQRKIYDREVVSLRIDFRKEQEDVEKLEGRSLANYFFQIIGKRCFFYHFRIVPRNPQRTSGNFKWFSINCNSKRDFFYCSTCRDLNISTV